MYRRISQASHLGLFARAAAFTRVRVHSETKQAVRAAGLLSAASLAAGLGNLVFHVVVARNNGPEAYGIIGALLTFGTIGGVLAVSTNYTVARTVARSEQLTPTLLSRCLRSVWPWLVLSGILLGASKPIQSYLQLKGLPPVFVAIGLLALVACGGAPSGMLVGLRRFRLIALLSIVAVAAKLAIGVLLAKGAFAVIGAIAASSATALVTGPTAMLVVLLTAHRKPVWEGPVVGAGAGGNLAGQATAGAVLAAVLWALWGLPLIFARHALSGLAAGDFAAAQLVASGVLYLSLPVVTGFFPTIARGRRQRTLFVGLAGALSISLVSVAALSAFGPLLMRSVYGVHFGASAALFATLGVSAMMVAAANYCIWAARAMSQWLFATYLGAGTAIAIEVTLGIAWHPSQLALAAAPCLSILSGMIVGISCVIASGNVIRERSLA